MFFKTAILKNFTTFTEKHPADLQLFKKETPDMCFPVNIAKFIRKDFSWNASGDCSCK